jgi:hypothetical protein
MDKQAGTAAPSKKKSRPKQPESLARKPLAILISEEERRLFWAAADADGLPIGTWMRMICLRVLRAKEEK